MDTPMSSKGIKPSVEGANSREELNELLIQTVSFNDFVTVTKTGIIKSNVLTAFVGLWLAANGILDIPLLIYTMFGTALIIASGCVINNHMDRDLDRYMERTKMRPTVTGVLKPKVTLWYGSILGVAGFLILLVLVHPLPAFLGLTGWVIYVVLYTPMKRTSTFNTAVGAFSGAVPPLIGWSAVTESLEMGAWVLFGILFLWQFPHFLALGIRKSEDYRKAGFAMLPVIRGFDISKRQIVLYTTILVFVSLLLYTYGEAGIIYLITSAVLGIIWIGMSIRGFFVSDDIRWSKGMFFYSLIYLLVICLAMIIDVQ